MKKGKSKFLSVLLILTMVFTMVAASVGVSYAATVYIYDQTHNMWIWPGGSRTPWVECSSNVTTVELWRTPTSDTEGWVKYKTCSYDSGSDVWYATISTTESENGSSWYYAFIARDGSDYEISELFRVECTDYLNYNRIMGDNRYETAIETAVLYSAVSDDVFPNVIIACGNNFADALGGTYLSAIYDAPILLVNKKNNATMDRVAGVIKEYLTSSGKVFILGGEGAVPSYMESALSSNGISGSRVKRFAGSNRYDTNLQVLKYCNVYDEELMVCCGTNFADALSASALGYPVALVGKTLSADQKAYFKTLDPYWVNLIGGTGAVNQDVENWFNSNSFDVWRYEGANRYETSALLASDYFYNRQSYFVFFAYGSNFPDGLSAGPLAYKLGAPLLLVRDNNYMDAEQFVLDNDCRYGLVMGGPSLISDETAQRLMLSSDLLGAPALEKSNAAPELRNDVSIASVAKELVFTEQLQKSIELETLEEEANK